MDKTRAILSASEGCVLVIDEAYGLYAGDGATSLYSKEVIDTLVGMVQPIGDDRAVLMLGYKREMEAMVQDANQGLARRFDMPGNPFVFQDFSDEEVRDEERGGAALLAWLFAFPEYLAQV